MRRRGWIILGLAVVAGALVVKALSTKHEPSPVLGGRPAPARKGRPPAIPAPRPLRIVHGPHDRPVPILMYHVINTPPATARYPELYVPTARFSAEMRALSTAGYTGVTIQQVYDYWRRGVALPPRPVVVSFDDGYLSHYTRALPVLRALDWPGVLNLEVGKIGELGALSPRMIRALIGAGWEVDSHTITHPDLTAIDPAQLRRELVVSRRIIRRRFGVPANFFCYPSGRFDATVVASVRAAGYRAATTTVPGFASPDSLFTLDRIRVNGSDAAPGLLARLAPARG